MHQAESKSSFQELVDVRPRHLETVVADSPHGEDGHLPLSSSASRFTAGAAILFEMGAGPRKHRCVYHKQERLVGSGLYSLICSNATLTSGGGKA